jgi:hypothetical protein
VGTAVSTVIGWVTGVIKALSDFDVKIHAGGAPIAQLATVLRTTLGGAFTAAGGFVAASATKVASFLASLSSFRTKVATLSTGLFDGLKEAFRTAINFIINGWNRLQFTVPSISIGGAKFGGGSIGVPHITPLATGGLVKARQGGTIAQIAEAGQDEVVGPLDKVRDAIGGGAAPPDLLDALTRIEQLLREFLERPAQVRLDNRLVGAVDAGFGRGGF